LRVDPVVELVLKSVVELPTKMGLLPIRIGPLPIKKLPMNT
jgi:hypothetical protein